MPRYHAGMKSKSALALFTLLLLSGCQGPGATDSAASTAVATAHPPVEADAERLRADVAWLADDAREGRRAGTRGEVESAAWIAQRMEELGLEPAGTDGFFQEFAVPLPARDGGSTEVSLVREAGGTALRRYRDPRFLAPLFCSSTEPATGRIAFAGYGIHDESLGWSDYEGLDVDGAVVLVVRGTPPASLLAEGSSWGSAGSLFQKVMEAKQRGAVAVLVALHPERLAEGLMPFDAGRTARANLPACMVNLPVASGLVPGFTDAVRRIDGGEAVARGEVETFRALATVAPDVVRGESRARNVLGLVRGAGDAPTIMLGAHFDHLGRGGPGSLAADGQGQIHNGADDNASGTAVVLEAARHFLAHPPVGDVLFALWSGEELGLLGSEHWAKQPTVPLDRVGANINLDMVGRAGSGKLQVLGAGTSPDFVGWLEEAGPASDLDLTISLSGQGLGGSDHQSFLKREIPAMHFFSGVHPDYHKPSDDVEGFEAEGAARVTRLTVRMTRHLQSGGELAYAKPAEPEGSGASRRASGFRTRFGSVPDYSYDGRGMRLSGTSANSPAEKAGLLGGDLIVRIDDVEVDGLGDFMYVLNAHKPGDVVQVFFLRGDEERQTTVTLESSAAE